MSTAPPASTTSEATLRPSSGSASTASLSMTAPIAGLRVSTSGVAASTETVSSSAPICSFTGITDCCSPAARFRFARRLEAGKRRFEAIRPNRQVGQRTNRAVGHRISAKPVSVWCAVTVTPGSAALSSTTVPLICAVVWAAALRMPSEETTPIEQQTENAVHSRPPRSSVH